MAADLPLCNCGHPRNFHAVGLFAGSACAVWTTEGLLKGAIHCPCQRYTPKPDAPTV